SCQFSNHSAQNWRIPSVPREVVPVRSGSRTTMSGSQSSNTASVSPRPNASYAARTISTFERATGPAVLRSFALPPQRCALDRLGEEHLLREHEVLAVVVGQLVLVAHGDRVEGARDLAVAAEDAAGEVDLVHLGVALAGRDSIVRIVLRGDDANAVGRTRGGAQRAPHALLETGVLELVELVAAAEESSSPPTPAGTSARAAPSRAPT